MRNNLKCIIDGKTATLVCLDPHCNIRLFCDGCSADHSVFHSSPTTIFSVQSLLQKNAVDDWFEQGQSTSSIKQDDLWMRHREFCLHMMEMVAKIDGFIKEKLKKESREFLMREQANSTKNSFQQFLETEDPEEGKRLFVEYALEYKKLISLTKNPQIGSSEKLMQEIDQLYSGVRLRMDSILEGVLHSGQLSRSVKSSLSNSRFKDSRILSQPEHKEFILDELFPEKVSFQLLFSAKDNDYKSSRFHELCDDQGPTLTIVQVNDNVFGGFTDVPWQSEGGFKKSSSSFLFSVDKKMKFGLRDSNKAVYHGKDYGPTFGGGHDLALYDKCGQNLASWSSLNFSYVVPEEHQGKAPKLLAGSTDFYVNEYEVYRVIYE